jgi:SAM-dependent methyltransferase
MTNPISTDTFDHPALSNPANIYRNLEEYVLYLTHLKAYEEAAGRWRGARMLDWGCNDGYGLAVLEQSAAEVCGVDVSSSCLELARARCGESVRLHLIDSEWRVPEPPGFDCVTLFQVLEHTTEYAKLFRNIASVMAPGASVFISTPNAVRRVPPGIRPWNRFHVHEFRPNELVELLSRFFRRVRLEGLTGTPPIVAIDERRIAARRLLAGAMYRERTRRLPESLLRPFILPPTTVEECQRTFSTRDLWFVSDDLDGAMDLFATCEDPIECDDVPPGESRTFAAGD